VALVAVFVAGFSRQSGPAATRPAAERSAAKRSAAERSAAERSAAKSVDTKLAAIDAVFTKFNSRTSPGCALAVIKDGHVVYQRGYGMANLEHEVPISPQTVFDIGSTSKQFTAASVVLLAQDRRLGLDDDVHAYVPELPDYGARITIRHLLTHTSGLRDYTDLLVLDGNDVADVTTPQDALECLVRQRGVNFPPGAEYSYCNSGFFLASVIVERVTGKSLRQFARERLFSPLGMSSTQYMDDHTLIVPHRATAYHQKDAGGFQVDMSDWEQTGDGAVLTSVQDLARWDANFYSPAVGGRQLVDALQTRGRLENGSPLDYALGLVVDEYHGVRRVQHGGSWAGYRAMLMRFPDQHFSVITLCNVDTARTAALAGRVADIFLAVPSQSTKTADLPVAADVSVADLARCAGTYVNTRSGSVLRVEAKADRLVVSAGGAASELIPLGSGRFHREDEESIVRFVPAGPGELRLELDARPLPAVYDRVQPPSELSEQKLAEFAGSYQSDELSAPLTLRPHGGKLWVRSRKSGAVPLEPVFADAFRTDADLIRFIREPAGRVAALSITRRGVRDLRLTKITR
jgi:CubicO group peptidase (beta-lactamase class C family)